jgi:DNA ligase-1
MFKPMLAPNEKTNLDAIQYPFMASRKLDGIRCLFIRGEILSRSLKPIPNKQLKAKFEMIRQYTEEYNHILDGEIFAPKIPFQLITSCVMTEDCDTNESDKKWKELCQELGVDMTRNYVLQELMFNCFDMVKNDDVNEPFTYRVQNISKLGLPHLVALPQVSVSSAEEVRLLFEETLAQGLEGLILRDPEGRYKCGRGTIKEGLIYKVKPWVTYDSKITGTDQATKVNEDADKKINELGRSVTSKKKDDRHVIEQAANFFVQHDGQALKVSLSSMTHAERDEAWKNRETLVGKTIEYKGMEIGAKDLPRHPVFVRFREDKDE